MTRDASPEDILDRLLSPGEADEAPETRDLRAAVLAEIQSTAEGRRCFEEAHGLAAGPVTLRPRPSLRFSAASAVVTVLAALLIPSLAFTAVVNIGRLLQSGAAEGALFGGGWDTQGLGYGPGSVLTNSLINLVACSTVAVAIVLVMSTAGGPRAPRQRKDPAEGSAA